MNKERNILDKIPGRNVYYLKMDTPDERVVYYEMLIDP